MRVACRIALALLGGLMAYSAAEHWVGSDDLRAHYAASPLGSGGLVGVAVAQTLAAVGLLWPRTQPLAGCVLAVVMFVAASTHIRAAGADAGVWLPVAIGVWALVPSVVLIVRNRRGATPARQIVTDENPPSTTMF
ncbi:MAG: DoxX family protein [Gemmataceae bacterium]|nr:DoxX family protein [Gemmataceae bacterium]